MTLVESLRDAMDITLGKDSTSSKIKWDVLFNLVTYGSYKAGGLDQLILHKVFKLALDSRWPHYTVTFIRAGLCTVCAL